MLRARLGPHSLRRDGVPSVQRRLGVLMLCASLCACGSAPEEVAPGVGSGASSSGSNAASQPADAEVTRWRSLRSRAAFDPERAQRVDPATAATMSVDAVFAWCEAGLVGAKDVREDIRAVVDARDEIEVRRARLLAHVHTGAAPSEALLISALESPHAPLREAAVLVCARSSARELPEKVLGRVVLSRDELALLDAPAASSEPHWNRISGAWVEERYRAALRYGLIDGRSGRAHAEAELRSDKAFLREVVLAALSPVERRALAPHVAKEIARGVSADLLASLLAACDAETLFPGRASLDAEQVLALRSAVLTPACSELTVLRLIEMRERLPSAAPWRGALQFVGGEPAAGLSLRRSFAALSREDALASLIILGYAARSEALALLSELAHPTREVGLHIFAARVACGDFAPLDLAFARDLEGSPQERSAAVEALIATGAARRQRMWITMHSGQLSAFDLARLSYAFGGTELIPLFPLLSEEAAPQWGGLAVERLLFEAAQIPPSLASGWPRGAAFSYDRALGAALVRAQSPRGVSLMEDALRELETDGAVLAASVLITRLGEDRGAGLLRAALLTANTAHEQARLGWIAGRLLSERALTWLSAESGEPDAARDAAWLGAAAARAQKPVR